MHKKSIFFGIGIGILAMVAITFVAYIVQRAAHVNENIRLVALLEAAETAPPGNNGEIAVDSYYVIDRARDMGMVFPNEIMPDATWHNEGPTGGYTTENGAYDAEYVYNPNAGYENNGGTNGHHPDLPQQTTEAAQNAIGMMISPGLTASEAAIYFEQMGLVDSADEFSQFLIEHSYATSIRAGYHIVPRGSSFEAIVDIIVYGIEIN